MDRSDRTEIVDRTAAISHGRRRARRGRVESFGQLLPLDAVSQRHRRPRAEPSAGVPALPGVYQERRLNADRGQAGCGRRTEGGSLRQHAAIVADYRGLTVSDMQAVRRALRSKGITYRVVKNRLARIAAKEAGREELTDLLDGPTGLAMGAPTRSPSRASSSMPSGRTRQSSFAAASSGGTLDASASPGWRQLPPREVLLAQLAGGMASPLATMASPSGRTVAEPRLRAQPGSGSEGRCRTGRRRLLRPRHPAEAEATAETEAPAEAEATAETEAPAEPEATAETEASAEAEATAETEAPAEAEAIAERRRPPTKSRQPIPTRLKPKPLNTDYDRNTRKETQHKMATKVPRTSCSRQSTA